MNDPSTQAIDQLEQQYRGQRVPDDRLLELLTSSAFHARASRGRSQAFHRDLLLALLELKRKRDLATAEVASPIGGESVLAGTFSPPGPAIDDPLEQAARDLLSLVQNKAQPMSHPDNVRLTDAGDTILVSEAHLLLLQLALPRRGKSPSDGEADQARSLGPHDRPARELAAAVDALNDEELSNAIAEIYATAQKAGERLRHAPSDHANRDLLAAIETWLTTQS